MNRIPALVLLIVAFLLCGLALVLWRSVPGTAHVASHARDLFDYKLPSADRLTVKRKGDVVYDLEREGAGWVYRTPALGEADPGRVANVLADLRFETHVQDDLTQREQTPRPDLYGLDRPAFAVAVRAPDGTTTWEIGAATPTKDGVYARDASTGRVVVANPGLVKAIDLPAEHFRAAAAAPAEGPAYR